MNDFKKTVEIIGGGTVSHVRAHLALSTVAYGTTAKKLKKFCSEYSDKLQVNCHLTKMSSGGEGNIETNEDVAELTTSWVKDPNVKIVFFNVAMCDFNGDIDVNSIPYPPRGKYQSRLSTHRNTRDHDYSMRLVPSEKVISSIRRTRKDIFLVGFKTTCGVSPDEQYLAGLNLLKTSSCNLVLANDLKTRKNMIITPEEASYHVTSDRDEALRNLVEMAYLRSHLTFTRSTVINGEPVPWESTDIPNSLRAIVDYCIRGNAYKQFNGATVGHFAAKISPTTFLTSRRKTNFNDLAKLGLVKIETDGPDSVLAYGSKPSVGGQSQRIVFEEHPEYDCIVHFHCPLREDHCDDVPVVSQREYECGSHECGQNTSRGLKEFTNRLSPHKFSAVMLDNHGPNIVFNRRIDPSAIIEFIQRNFILSAKTGGPVK